jgi:RNA polymerase sigma factor (sigma-70 family)
MNKAHSHRLKALIQTEHQKLLGYVHSKIDSLEESEDLPQDVYVHLLGHANVLDSVDNLTGWLYTITRNKVIDWYRKRKIRTVSIEAPIGDGLRFEDILTSELPESMDEETRELVYRRILECIDHLPENQRFVFIEQVVQGRTFRELAEETGESINTLIARKQYAIRFLRNELKTMKQTLLESVR